MLGTPYGRFEGAAIGVRGLIPRVTSGTAVRDTRSVRRGDYGASRSSMVMGRGARACTVSAKCKRQRPVIPSTGTVAA